MNKNIIIGCCLVFSTFLMLSSCRRDKFDTNPSTVLYFSTDTVTFDTVFTTLHSSTRKLMVYNRSKHTVKISRIFLGGRTSSYYKINVDGLPTSDMADIEIKGRDSIFIQVNVTINPNDINTPFIVEDSINFLTNGNYQNVKLVSYGQNANFFQPPKGKKYYIIGTDTTWTNELPFVIYGWVAVDSLATLRIEKGCKIYFHKGSGILVYRDGSMKVNGTLQEPVVFRNDRLDYFYKDLPGQWEGLWYSEGSVANELNYATIENGRLGVQVDLMSNKSVKPTLTVTNTILRNLELGGIASNGAYIKGDNLIISGCGSYAMALNAGLYDFKQISVGNYGGPNISGRSVSSFLLTNYFVSWSPADNAYVRFLMDTKAYFGNTVISGNMDEELAFSVESGATLDYLFDHCVLKTKINVSDIEKFKSVIVSRENPFVDAAKFNLMPAEKSVLRNAGIPMGIEYDYNGIRLGDKPDIGALQWQPAPVRFR